MKPQILALLTAIAWGVGGYFEKKGLHLGGLSPVAGITIRTTVACLILLVVGIPEFKSISQASTKSLIFMILGGGVLAGAIGMLAYYSAIKAAPLSQVMPIAFTSPIFGALMGVIFSGEPLTFKKLIGILLTFGGVLVLTL